MTFNLVSLSKNIKQRLIAWQDIIQNQNLLDDHSGRASLRRTAGTSKLS